MAIGPMNMGDLAGNDIGYLVRKEKGLVNDPETGLPKLCCGSILLDHHLYTALYLDR